MIYFLLIGIYLPFIFGHPIKTQYNNKINNPELNSGYFEGDIILHPEQRLGLIDTQYYWPKAEVPFEINGNFTDEQIRIIYNAITKYYEKTCITFRKRHPLDKDYVSFQNDKKGCFSAAGKHGGKQVTNLENGCFYRPGIAIHEMMHTIGFFHEQSRMDRDDYVTIHFENINEKMAYNFNKLSEEHVTYFNVSYDYGSVMHYNAFAYSINGQPTIVPKDPQAEIGQREGLSEKDVLKINRMYKCLV